MKTVNKNDILYLYIDGTNDNIDEIVVTDIEENDEVQLTYITYKMKENNRGSGGYIAVNIKYLDHIDKAIEGFTQYNYDCVISADKNKVIRKAMSWKRTDIYHLKEKIKLLTNEIEALKNKIEATEKEANELKAKKVK